MTTKVTTLRLPNDCIYDILKHFKCSSYYHSTLFNCLFVNRFWCKTAVPLLYADPFRGRNKRSSIISTLISCFSKSEILQLKNLLKSSISNHTNNHINIDYINDECKPLFDYIRYLENYDFDVIDEKINYWLELSPFHKGIYNDIYDDVLDDICPLFHQLLSHRCNDIKKLRFSTEHLDDIIVTQKNLSNMENICLNLRKLEITIFSNTSNTINEKLCMIIQKQNNLKAFKLLAYTGCAVFTNDIILSLEFQKHSLVYLEFYRAEFSGISFKNSLNLYNLKHLEFHKCEELSLNQCEIFNFSPSKLEVLVLNGNKWDDDVMSTMIKYLGAPLQALVASPLTISVIESISLYCSNLTTLDIYLDSNTDSFVFPYFKNLKIRKLFLRSKVSLKTPHFTTLKNFMNLANNLSTSVKEVSVIIDYKQPNHLYFKAFLENCHNCLETIHSSNNRDITLDLLKIIFDYTERSNSLKFLSISVYEFNTEESKLWDKIMAKGVERTFITKHHGLQFDMF